MKQKLQIIIGGALLMCTMVFGHSVYAQEFVPLSKLAQEVLIRTTEQVSQTLDTTRDIETQDQIKIQETVEESNTIDNTLVQNSITESIDTISKTTEDLDREKDIVVDEIKNFIKEDIDDSIIQIRRETQKQAHELQQVIDTERTQLFENVTRSIDSTTTTSSESLLNLRQDMDMSIQVIEQNLQAEAPDVRIDFAQARRQIEQRLKKFEEILNEKREIVQSREGALVYLDSDGDGLSDYDEMYIYGTDPDNAYTVEGELNDGEKVARGINPLSESMEQKQYQNPQEDRTSFVSENYKVEKVQLLKENDADVVAFEGRALPNSFVTLYIFSTPIVVTVKTDVSGKWTYELEEELENGEHQIFVATVDSSGSIVARSNPILFTKSAEAAVLGLAGSIDSTSSTQNFLKDNFVLITLAILIMFVLLGMMFIGNHHNIKSAISELREEVNTK